MDILLVVALVAVVVGDGFVTVIILRHHQRERAALVQSYEEKLKTRDDALAKISTTTQRMTAAPGDIVKYKASLARAVLGLKLPRATIEEVISLIRRDL